MAMLLDLLIAACLLLGASFALIGSIGLARLDDFYMRLHGPTKATTLGVGGLLVASSLYFSTRGDGISLHELLVAAFLLLTAPGSAHLLTRAARHIGVAEHARPAEPEDSSLRDDHRGQAHSTLKK